MHFPYYLIGKYCSQQAMLWKAVYVCMRDGIDQFCSTWKATVTYLTVTLNFLTRNLKMLNLTWLLLAYQTSLFNIKLQPSWISTPSLISILRSRFISPLNNIKLYVILLKIDHSKKLSLAHLSYCNCSIPLLVSYSWK